MPTESFWGQQRFAEIVIEGIQVLFPADKVGEIRPEGLSPRLAVAAPSFLRPALPVSPVIVKLKAWPMRAKL